MFFIEKIINLKKLKSKLENVKIFGKDTKYNKFARPSGLGRDRPGPAWERKERGKIERSVMLLKGSWLLSDS